MGKFIYAFAAVFAIGASTLAQSANREFRTLVQNNSHVVSYEKQGEDLVLTMEMIADYTEDRKAPRYQDQDIASFKIDINNNGTVNRMIDVAFGPRALTDTICTQYLLSLTAATSCRGLRSRALFSIHFERSAFHDTPHPLFRYTIPTRELAAYSKTIGLQFVFHSKGKGFTFYPDGASLDHSFKETLSLNLDEL